MTLPGDPLVNVILVAVIVVVLVIGLLIGYIAGKDLTSKAKDLEFRKTEEALRKDSVNWEA